MITFLAGIPECREQVAEAALPALISLLRDTSNLDGSRAAASIIAKLAASPALLPGIKQVLSMLVISRLVSSLTVRGLQPTRDFMHLPARPCIA